MRLEPRLAPRLIDLRQSPANRVLADHLAHAEQWRIHRIRAQRRNVRITPMPGQNRQHQRAQHVALARRIRADERQRTIRHPAVEQAALLQIFYEERQLSERRDGLRRAPPPSKKAPLFKYSKKNGKCPRGVTGCAASHSTCTRPPNVSATADHSSI